MLAVRRLAALALFGLLAAILAGPANAVRPPQAPTYPEVLTTSHFQVHYTGSSLTGDEITHQMAGDVAAHAEKAYSTLVTGWGYPAPLPDADGKTDIWVMDLSALGALGIADQDTAGSNPTTSWMAIDPSAVDSLEVVAHELTHAIQFGLWNPTDSWLLEGTAKWAGLAATGYIPFSGLLVDSLGAPDMSLTCSSPACGDTAEVGGYTRWEFFQYLTERFGKTIVRDVFAQGAVTGSTTQTGADLLGSTLAAKGTTLSDVYGDYTFAQVAGNYQVTALKGLAPVPYSSLQTGTESAALPVREVVVNHLATRYLKFMRGGGSGLCFAATLNLTVALPAGIGSRPSFYSKALGTAPVALTTNGDTASLSVPWDTCTGTESGYLALPNPSLATDAQVFVVSGSIVVDTSTIYSSNSPPPSSYTGPSGPGAVGDVAPAIRLYGAQLIRVSSANRLVRLIVFSSGGGQLRGALGSTPLGTRPLRAGNNDIRFKIPARALKALRSTSAAGAPNWRLTLTSLSTTGTKGKSVTRKVVVSKPTRR